MFDVSWNDPGTETVGQRKNRKNLESSAFPRRSSIHSTRSSEASSLHTQPPLLNIFGGKKQTLSRTRSHSKLFSSLPEDSLESPIKTSSYTARSEDSSHGLPSATQFPVSGYSTGRPDQSNVEQCSFSDASESVCSGWTDRSRRTDSTWTIPGSTNSSDSIVQPLGPKSYVIQSTEITVTPRESVDAADQVATVVHISAANTIPMQDWKFPTRTSPSATSGSPVKTFNQDDRVIPKASLNDKKQSNFQGRQLNSWKPPEEWQCPLNQPETPETISPKSLDPPSRLEEERSIFTKGQGYPPMGISLQRSIRRMESASQKTILRRLKDECAGPDALVTLGLEVEKQFWMLTALRRDSVSGTDSENSDSLASKRTKALSLYENYAFSSFLSVLTAATELHHLSTAPLSSWYFPNVCPLSVPSPSSRLPYATGIFTDIHAFPLPALLPASLIPQLLKECHRTLTCGGKLHLTIVNPLPIALGPQLRDWLDSHLILNLERQFRCTNPGRLFPIWLADSGFCGEESTLCSNRFFACVSAESPLSPIPGASGMGNLSVESEVDQNEVTNEELKSMVGRMLWKEMWGSFVEGAEWWWDNESVVEECERLGTCWEHTIIEAVKER